MIIAANTVVTLAFELSDIWDNLIERPEEPVQYLHGDYGDIFPAVEAALAGKSEKDSVEVRLEPGDAFGDYDAEKIKPAWPLVWGSTREWLKGGSAR